jgi:ABC-type Fe3+/spermidine/putrescine transport system ATPase subunit
VQILALCLFYQICFSEYGTQAVITHHQPEKKSMGKRVVVMKRVKSQKKSSAELIYPNSINAQVSKGMRNWAYRGI